MTKEMTIEDLVGITIAQSKRVEDLTTVVGNLAEEMRSGFVRMEAKMATKEEMDEKIDSLATMITENMASKEDVRYLAEKVNNLSEGLEAVKTELRDNKETQKSFNQKVDTHQEEIGELNTRVNKLEDKVFVA